MSYVPVIPAKAGIQKCDIPKHLPELIEKLRSHLKLFVTFLAIVSL